MNKNTSDFTITNEVALIKVKLLHLPKPQRKNLFDILKIQHREICKSNIIINQTLRFHLMKLTLLMK